MNRKSQVIGLNEEEMIGAATIFLFGDINWRECGEQLDLYKAKLSEIAKNLKKNGFKERYELCAATEAYINPDIIEQLNFNPQKVAMLYSYERTSIDHQGGRLNGIGIEKEPLATICYCTESSPKDRKYTLDLSNDHKLYSIRDLIFYALGFAELGLDFLLTRDRASIENGKIIVSEAIQDKILAADHQQSSPYMIKPKN